MMMLLVELKATTDLDQQHSLYSPKTYNLVYNNNVYNCCTIGFRNLQGPSPSSLRRGGAGYLTHRQDIDKT